MTKYIYIWDDGIGISDNPPTEQDNELIGDGDLFVISIKGNDLNIREITDAINDISSLLMECKNDAGYHYV